VGEVDREPLPLQTLFQEFGEALLIFDHQYAHRPSVTGPT
jgi:hypothetical protein